MIKGIFFATFDINEGPKLHHLLPQPLPGQWPLFDFKVVAPYLIPPPALCNALLNILTPTHRDRQPPGSTASPTTYRILSYPVCISSEAYPRNAFTFNFGLVLDARIEFSSYIPIVKKLATLFRGLEEQSWFLSKDLAASESKQSLIDALPLNKEQHTTNKRDSLSSAESDNDVDNDLSDHPEDAAPTNEAPPSTDTTPLRPPTSSSSAYNTTTKIFALSEILLEDLNNYGETQIPLDASNTLNLKLFPTYPPPPPLYAWQVPLATVPLNALLSPTSIGTAATSAGLDLTMARVLPHIDGVNSVKRIAHLADADFNLVRKAIRHLLYYGCCILLDIFAFGAIYAPTPEIARFVANRDWQDECLAYVALPTFATPTARSSSSARPTTEYRNPTTTTTAPGADTNSTPATTATPTVLTAPLLTHLYLSLRQGLTVKAWAQERPDILPLLDLRRFITFGVLKGFLYRVHKYAIAVPPPHSSSLSSSAPPLSTLSRNKKKKKKEKEEEESDTAREDEGGGGGAGEQDKQLAKFLDGQHCFDEICTELGISERELVGRLKGWRGGEVCVVCR